MNQRDLAEKLSILLGDVVTMSHVTQGYHWNVKGIEFTQMHEFFADVYEDVDGSIDPLAENIRKIGFESPYLLTDFIELSCIKPTRVSGDAKTLLSSLSEINYHIIACIVSAFEVANALNEQGIANFLAERQDMHQKWQWQIESSLGIR